MLTEAEKAQARELGARIRAYAQSPAGRGVLAGLEAAFPEFAAEVRAAMADPAPALGRLGAHMAREATREIAKLDTGLARVLSKALRGPTKARPR